MTPEHRRKSARSTEPGTLAKESCGLDTEQAQAVESLPMVYRATLRKAFTGAASPRQAIKAKCIDCTCGHRCEIRECPSNECPLWRFRPYQKEGKT